MPLYEYECPTCGPMDLFHKMSEKVSRCPTCKSKKLHRTFNTAPAGKVYGSFWETENGGRGRFIDYLAKSDPACANRYDTKDTFAYCRSPQEAIEKGKRVGLKLKKA